MLREGKGMKSLVALVPGMFMTAVVVTFILWTSIDKGQPWGLVPGGVPLVPAIAVSVAVAIVFAAFALRRGHCAAKQRP